MELYLKYLERKDYRIVEYLYQYYGTEKTRSFKDFILFYLNYFDRNFKKKSFYDFFNFIIKNETTLPFIEYYAIEENKIILKNKKLKIVELLNNNNTLKLVEFSKKK